MTDQDRTRYIRSRFAAEDPDGYAALCGVTPEAAEHYAAGAVFRFGWANLYARPEGFHLAELDVVHIDAPDGTTDRVPFAVYTFGTTPEVWDDQTAAARFVQVVRPRVVEAFREYAAAAGVTVTAEGVER